MVSDDPTEKPYHLVCVLRFIQKSVNEVVGQSLRSQSYERKMCILIPDESDQRTDFMSAWLPDTSKEYYEIGAYIAYPVDSPCRMSIHRADEKSDRHYLFVMTKGVEDILVKLKEGSRISLKVMPASHDEEIDRAIDTQLDIEAMQ